MPESSAPSTAGRQAILPAGLGVAALGQEYGNRHLHGLTLPGGERTAIMGSTDTLTTAAAHRFPATTSSVGQARRFLIAQLPGASDGEADALVLMLSELATNAVQHAATEFEVEVLMAPDGHLVRVEVTDEAAGIPTPQEQISDAPHGRGLHIVRALADAWGIEVLRDRPGKTVWFSLPLPPR